MQGQPSTPSTPTWGRACPSWWLFFFEEPLLFGTWMGSPVCWAHIATPKIWVMVYTETALYHKTVSKTQQRKDHHINPELTYYSLRSSQWAAENYSFILLTNNIFKKILENECFHDWHRYKQGAQLLEVFAFATEHRRQFWAWMAQMSMLAARSKTHVSNPLFLASYTLLGEVCKKQGKKTCLAQEHDC